MINSKRVLWLSLVLLVSFGLVSTVLAAAGSAQAGVSTALSDFQQEDPPPPGIKPEDPTPRTQPAPRVPNEGIEIHTAAAGSSANLLPPLICSSPALPITDNFPAGVTDTLNVANPAGISDLNVYISATHTWVGDLIFTLEHVGTGITRTIYDRPGVPASTFGCSGNDIDATIDDEAATAVENECAAGTPTISGSFIGGDPPNSALLAAFDGLNVAGDWQMTVSDNAGGDAGVLQSWCIEPSLPSINFTKTVGLDPGVCATTSFITVLPGTDVYYCYQVENTGNITLSTHDLFDTQLGTILSGFNFDLSPGASVWLTQTALITQTTQNSANWTAYNPGPSDVAFDSDFATVALPDSCYATSVPIPDNDPNGITTTVVLRDIEQVADLDVLIQASHTWVGDLIFTLEHVNSGITATIYDRPGVPASTFGCSGNDIDAILDDEGLDGDLETTCGAGTPTIMGSLVPGDPPNTSLLATFDGLDLAGPWNMHVSDRAGGDTGNLVSWCLLPTLGQPTMQTSPGSLASTQPQNNQVDTTLDIHNAGDFDLSWEIFENAVPFRTFGRADLSVMGPAPEGTDGGEGAWEAAGAEVPASAVADLAPPPPDRAAAPNADLLYNNGPLVNSSGTGAGGADESILQDTSLGLLILGFGHQWAFGNRIADDFTVSDPGGWLVSDIDFFAYQTNSPTSSPMTGVNFQIWDGPPDNPASSVVFGDDFTNRMIGTVWSGIYRVTEATAGTATNRPIMTNTVSAGVFLPPGTYWLDWQTDGQLPSGPWAPPITINGVITTGNGLQSVDNGVTWNPVLDFGTGSAQGFPFQIRGCAPEALPWIGAAPGMGITAPGATTNVTVTFDSNGIPEGVHTGNLCVLSDDPFNTLSVVPLTLTVENVELNLPVVRR